MHQSFRLGNRAVVFFVTLALIVSSLSSRHVKAASVSSVALSGFDCSLPSVQIAVSGTFSTNDGFVDGGGNPLDLFGTRLVDGSGNTILQTTFAVVVGGTAFAPGIDYLISSPSSNPITIEIYEAVDYAGFGGLLASASFDSPCLAPSGIASGSGSSQPIDPEAARGIKRLYGDAIVIAQQPNGDLDYYRPDGCFVGRTPHEYIGQALLAQRYIMQTINGCDRYKVDVWSLGYPACQIQINMYGSDGWEGVYQLQPRPTDATCRVSWPQRIANGIIYMMQKSPEINEIYDVSSFVAKVVASGEVSPSDLACTSAGILVGNNENGNRLIEIGDFGCVWGGALISPFGWIPILLNPQRYIDTLLDPAYEFLRNAEVQVACFFYPDFTFPDGSKCP